jgi:anti-repressor protein
MMRFDMFSSDLDVVVGENKFHTFKEAAKIINIDGLGQNKLLKLLREKKLLSQYNEPLEEWKNSGFFKIANNRYTTTLISTYGINYIQKHYI